MKLPRRRFLQLAAGAAALPAVSRIARAQAYPTQPVHLVVGFVPGGISDTYARLIGQSLSERLGQSIIIENRPGAGGNIATDSVQRAAPDGYTLLLTGSNDAWNMTLYDNLNYNYIRDIAPVAGLSRGMGALVVLPSYPAKTVPDLIAYARDNPGKVSVGSGGIGSSSHVFFELFKMMAHVEMVHVPYRGEGPALTDLLGGQVHAIFPTLPPSIEYIRSGKLRPLAVTAAKRSEALPDVPTIGEFLPGYDASGYIGIGAPRSTPAEIVGKLNKEINACLADPKMKQRIAELGDAVFAGSPGEFGTFIAEFSDRWAKVFRAGNIKI
jgi:tripartite-type tricarboxylate transporter receptor subunit TctC